MVSCCVPGCSSNSLKHKKNIGVGFHRFPKDPKRLREWERSINIAFKVNMRICSKHFKRECFYSIKGLRQLTKDSNPTELLNLLPKDEDEPIDVDMDSELTPLERELKNKSISYKQLAVSRMKKISALHQSKKRLIEKIKAMRKLLSIFVMRYLETEYTIHDLNQPMEVILENVLKGILKE